MTDQRWTRRTVMVGLSTALPGLAFATSASPLAATFDVARRLPQLRSLIITHRGKILEAEAFRGPPLDRPVNVKSVSKSLISALTGIAIDRGELSGTDQLIAPLLRRTVPRRADRRVHDITVGDMLSMRSGLQELSGAAYGVWANSKNWIYDALSKPMVADPGTAMLYSTASYHILGAVLSRVAGTDLHDLAGQRLGVPLGIDIPEWTRDPQGRFLGGNDMRISPLAMIRFGEMYRRGGDWRSVRVVPRDWIDRSWTPYTASVETGHGYGWFLWQTGGYDVIYARGYGGQMIYILPGLEMVVAMTSDPSRPARLGGHLGDLNRLLAEWIVPAAESLA
ncbi:MAG: serine hydrolase [Rhodobacter sp.]|nr:serine hydrolase [Rhodobacter sp.]